MEILFFKEDPPPTRATKYITRIPSLLAKKTLIKVDT